MKEKGKWQTAAEAIIGDRKKANQVCKTIANACQFWYEYAKKSIILQHSSFTYLGR